MQITNDIIYVGVNDHKIDLFEGQYIVPNGMAYNSYVIKDEKIAIMDTVDKNFTHEWLDNLEKDYHKLARAESFDLEKKAALIAVIQMKDDDAQGGKDPQKFYI